MCGRFALYSPYPKLSASLRLPLEEPGELTPRYNVAPGTFITAVRRADDNAPLVIEEGKLQLKCLGELGRNER